MGIVIANGVPNRRRGVPSPGLLLIVVNAIRASMSSHRPWLRLSTSAAPPLAGFAASSPRTPLMAHHVTSANLRSSDGTC